jgi:hypothetical protein
MMTVIDVVVHSEVGPESPAGPFEIHVTVRNRRSGRKKLGEFLSELKFRAENIETKSN